MILEKTFKSGYYVGIVVLVLALAADRIRGDFKFSTVL